jgi:hypothetical protein
MDVLTGWFITCLEFLIGLPDFGDKYRSRIAVALSNIAVRVAPPMYAVRAVKQ